MMALSASKGASFSRNIATLGPRRVQVKGVPGACWGSGVEVKKQEVRTGYQTRGLQPRGNRSVSIYARAGDGPGAMESVDESEWKLHEAWAHWVDAGILLWRVPDCDQHGVPYRFFLHASPTASLRATPDGLVSDELQSPPPLPAEESVVCVSSGADSPLTPASYTESMRSPFSRSGRPSGGFRTSGSAFRAGSRDSLASLSSAEAQREDQGAGIDPHAAAVELECMGSWSDCPDAVRTSRPFLQGCLALRVPPSVAPRVLRGILKGQVAVSACDSSGRLARCTGVQTAGAIDALFPYDGSLGAFVDRSAGTVTISVWAPTAQSVQLTLFREPRGDAFLTVPMQPGAMGAWHARGPSVGEGSWDRAYYQIRVGAFHPETNAIESMVTSDPYARCTSADGERAMVVDMRDPDLRPSSWGKTSAPRCEDATDIAVYELHIRDFSATDPSVPPEHRGKYAAFGLRDTHGRKHLERLAGAGITHLHLLPTYDFATVPEREEDRADLSLDDERVSRGVETTSQVPQALLAEVADRDSYNWGYDPVHYLVPEGSYASEPDGVARIVEMREMVEAIHEMGLSVVLDVVYNHTFASGPTSRYSVLDKVVPGYYHRRSEGGRVLDSTCCNNTACEHRMMGRLVVDDLLHWALHYGIDGFRFDIMGHLMKSTVLEAQRRLARLTVAQDGVDGGRIYLYGEGWNFGEMVGNARGVNAWQDNLRGSGIGSFNDRIRDKGLGGSPFSDARCQGFLTGLATMPRTEPDLDQGTPEQQWENLAHQTDVLKLCMLGSLSSLSVPQCGGGSIHASEFRYPDGSLVAFAQEPDESVNYVACHDNRTLWDQCVFKAPLGTSRETVVRMCMLSHALVVLSQGIPFIGAGDELLRSKSLDRDSYNSGDWFNRVDWTGTSNGFGAMGLPPASKNRDYWPLMVPVLEMADEIAPTPADIALSLEWTIALLRVRRSTKLLRLPSAESIRERACIHAGNLPGVLAVEITSAPQSAPDGGQRACSSFRRILVVINARPNSVSFPFPGASAAIELHSDLASSGDPHLADCSVDAANETVHMAPHCAAVFVERWQ